MQLKYTVTNTQMPHTYTTHMQTTTPFTLYPMFSTNKVPTYTINTYYTISVHIYVDRDMDCGFPTHSPESSFIGQSIAGFPEERSGNSSVKR